MPLPAGVVVGTLFEPYLRTGVYKRLSGDAVLMGMLIGGIQDGNVGTASGGVQKFPYVSIGKDSSEIRADRLTGSGSVVFLPLDIKSTYAGSKEVLAIAERICFLLARQERMIRIQRYNLSMLFVDSTQTYENEDNTWTTVIRLHAEGQPIY